MDIKDKTGDERINVADNKVISELKKIWERELMDQNIDNTNIVVIGNISSVNRVDLTKTDARDETD